MAFRNTHMCMQIVAQFHVPSPLIKAHEMYFARYARQIDTNAWVVADVSLEAIFPSPMVTCQRKPSGCIIQALQDGFSTVIAPLVPQKTRVWNKM